MCSSDAELARRLEISPTLLSLMRSHDRAITTDTALKLGELLNIEARDALELAAIHNDTHGKFRDYLGKALAAGVAAVWVFSYAGVPIGAMEAAASELTILHIVLSSIAMGTALRVLASATRTRTRTRIPLRFMSTCLRVFVSTWLQPARYALGALSAAFAGMDRPGFACRKTAQK